MPFVIAITGKSDAGKTSLIKGLIPEMKRRGYKVAVVKNCPREKVCLDAHGNLDVTASQRISESMRELYAQSI